MTLELSQPGVQLEHHAPIWIVGRGLLVPLKLQGSVNALQLEEAGAAGGNRVAFHEGENITYLIHVEKYGNGSYQRLMGVQFVTDGSVYSIQDMLPEQTVSYVASDFTPLMPLTMSAFYQPAQNDRTVAPERTVADVWTQGGFRLGSTLLLAALLDVGSAAVQAGLISLQGAQKAGYGAGRWLADAKRQKTAMRTLVEAGKMTVC